jgi:serine/threonine-protein kinase
MAAEADPTRFAPTISSPPSDDEARAFLQERMAYLGKAYAAIGIGFYLIGNLADIASGPGFLSRRVTDVYTWVVPTSCAMYLAQWALCRGSPCHLPLLRFVDGTTTILAAAFHSMLVFSSIPNELPGLSYTRSLLLFTFGQLIRAILIPSSARRTLLLGLGAAAVPVATSHRWYSTQTLTTLPAGMHAVWTLLWCLGTVVIATLASRVIFGLRQQVREAWQLGQYTLLEKIGEGGMGAVYRASHAMLRRPTAVKLLRADRAGTRQLERFEREVQLTSQLTHANTVAIFDYGRTPDGVFYYAMEYLEGLNLEDLVLIDGAQPPGRVVHILRQVASSLAEAHGIGLIHRDIKPGNVILVAERGGASDVAKVVDFGLVKELDSNLVVTGDHEMAGTPHYLAPESISSPDEVGPRSDLYSLGCLGYCLLTGHTVFDGRTVVEICSHHLHSLPLPLSKIDRAIPPSLSELVMACLEKMPDRRPASAQSLVDELDACRAIEPWTTELGQVWWREKGRPALARLHHQRMASSHPSGATTSVSASLVRPGGARKPA